MVKPLRDAYEYYENERIEEEKLRKSRNERTRSTEEPNFTPRSTSQDGQSDSPIRFTAQSLQSVADVQNAGDEKNGNEEEKQVRKKNRGSHFEL
jgi:hypothetical protein